MQMVRLFIVAVCLLIQACSNPEEKRKSRLETIDTELKSIQVQITEEEKKALDANVQSEGYMRADYAHFAESLEKSEGSEHRIDELKENLQRLIEEKKALEQR
jgi:hypothetical protein